MARETWIQSHVESYQRLKKWYLMPPCLTLSIITYGSRVKWVNPGKGVVPFPTPWCNSYQKESLWVSLNYARQLYFNSDFIGYHSSLTHDYYYYYINRAICLMSRLFTNGQGDQGSIPGRVIPKTQKMVLDATLLNTQRYKVRSKGKVEQYREWRNCLPYNSML